MVEARLIYDSPTNSTDLLYATGFWAPDPVIFFECRGKKYLVLSSLEIDRANKEACVDNVLQLESYINKAKKNVKDPNKTDVLDIIFKEYKIKSLIVPISSSFVLIDSLRKKGYRVKAGTEPFFLERHIKTKEEVKYILQSQRVVFAAIDLVKNILVASKIKNGKLIYRGATLTSEKIRQTTDMFLMERGFISPETIISSGEHSLYPHDLGSGPIKANTSIIVDIFPKSKKTGYFGDATRTFCKGRASEALKKMYQVVLGAQKLGISMVRNNAEGKLIHEAIHAFFRSKGYETGVKDGRNQGFIHGTGHGIGLEVHEEPLRINFRKCRLATGNVMSVEPGLYYKGIGGVRIEDLVHITKNGCEVLGHYPKVLEVR